MCKWCLKSFWCSESLVHSLLSSWLTCVCFYVSAVVRHCWGHCLFRLSVCSSIPLCVRPYKPLGEIFSNLQLWCSWDKDEKSESWADQMWPKIHLCGHFVTTEHWFDWWLFELISMCYWWFYDFGHNKVKGQCHGQTKCGQKRLPVKFYLHVVSLIIVLIRVWIGTNINRNLWKSLCNYRGCYIWPLQVQHDADSTSRQRCFNDVWRRILWWQSGMFEFHICMNVTVW